MFKASSLLHRACIYEVNIRQYTPEGSFRAFTGHLPRLKDMGVDILWLMPVFPIGEIRRKGELGSYYSIRDFKEVNPEFGSPEDLRSLIRECHRLGMKVIIDWVANHTALDHIWTTQHPEFYVRDESGDFFSPYDWSDVIQLDHGNMAQQDAMVEAMLFWIREFDIDGFRADLAHLTPLAFWKMARQKADALKPGLIWLAESEDAQYHEAFDISFTWQWMHQTEKVCRGQYPVFGLKEVLDEYRGSFSSHAFRLFFTSNHDENSWNGTEEEKYGAYAGLLTIFSFLYASVPLIYSGQEIPNRERLPFFHHHSLNWPVPPQLHDFYKGLAELRHSHPALGSNDNSSFVPVQLLSEKTLAFYRHCEDDQIVVLLNFSHATTSINYPFDWPAGDFRDHCTGDTYWLSPGLDLTIHPAGALVLIKKSSP